MVDCVELLLSAVDANQFWAYITIQNEVDQIRAFVLKHPVDSVINLCWSFNRFTGDTKPLSNVMEVDLGV